MKKFLALLLAAMMVLGLVACGGSADSGSGSSSGSSDGSAAAPAEEASGEVSADSGKYMGVMLATNVMSLDTNLATDGDSFEVIADCIDGLMQMDADSKAVSAIAESYDLSDDGTVYTFHLRDANWSNGTP